MKKLFALLSIVTCATSFSFSQEEQPTKIKEIFITHSAGSASLSNAGIGFRIGSRKALWRLNLLRFSGQNFVNPGGSQGNESVRIRGGIQTGVEFRKEIFKNFDFRYGFDLSYDHDFDSSEQLVDGSTIKTTSHTYIPGFNLVLGGGYCFWDKLVIGAEFMPGVQYRMSNIKTTGLGISTSTNGTSGFNWGLSNYSFLMSIGFRF